MSTIRVFAKGPAKSAKRAAARHGIALKKVVTNKWDNGVRADTSCKNLSKLIRWMTDKSYTPASDGRSGRGAQPGTLLFYSTKACPAGDLRGGFGRAKRR